MDPMGQGDSQFGEPQPQRRRPFVKAGVLLAAWGTGGALRGCNATSNDAARNSPTSPGYQQGAVATSSPGAWAGPSPWAVPSTRAALNSFGPAPPIAAQPYSVPSMPSLAAVPRGTPFA